MGIHSSETMLIAATVLKSLDVVCEYAIPLAKRTGKNAVLHVLLVLEEGADIPDQDEIDRRLLAIRERGVEADVEIEYSSVRGRFSDKVAECLYNLDCPLLVVGDGNNRNKRLKDLKEIEHILIYNKSWHHQKSHHFLIVSERRKDPVLEVFNQKNRNQGRKPKNG